jgi:DNA-binding NarL/FixJ family response regulator
MRRVLVIDDHEPSRRHLVRTLTEAKYEIAGEGASGEQFDDSCARSSITATGTEGLRCE